MLSISGSESENEADRIRFCGALFRETWKVPSWMGWTAGGLLCASCISLMLTGMEIRRLLAAVSAWRMGPAPPQVTDHHAVCPCDCERGSSDEFSEELDRCRAGGKCFFGNGWCSRTVPSFETSERFPHSAMRSCQKRRCGGPRAHSFNVTCDRGNDPPFAVDWLVRHFGSQVRGLLKDGAAGVNRHLNAPGDDLVDTLEVQLDRLSVVWRIGCWPPARYVVAGGILRVRSGWVRLAAGDFTLEVHLSDGIVWFTDLRVEISCPEGVFTIDGFGDGALNTGALSTASLKLAPETKVSGIRCSGGWGLWCWWVRHLAPESFVWEQLPTILVDVIQSFTGFALANGCHLSRNSFALLPYVHKECCEENYRSDHNGCLVGGQFNGRFMPQGPVEGVDCAYNKDLMSFQARCEAVPGSYTEKSPGVCWEVGLPWRPPTYPNFDGQAIKRQVWQSVQRLLLAELTISMALWTIPLILLAKGALVFRRTSQREFIRMRT